MSDAEQNGKPPEPPQEPRQGEPMQLGMQITTQGVVFSFPAQLGLGNEAVKQFIKQYLAAHPELVQEIAREAIAQKQQELQFIEMVRRSKNVD